MYHRILLFEFYVIVSIYVLVGGAENILAGDAASSHLFAPLATRSGR